MRRWHSCSAESGVSSWRKLQKPRDLTQAQHAHCLGLINIEAYQPEQEKYPTKKIQGEDSEVTLVATGPLEPGKSAMLKARAKLKRSPNISTKLLTPAARALKLRRLEVDIS